jgi:hypothetical protein
MLKRQDLAAMASTWLLVLLAWAAFSPTASAQLNRVSVNQIIGTLTPGNGGTGSAFFQVAGPASSIKTFTFPNASANVLTDNALVTAAQGGTSNGFFAVSGPASTTKTFTFPNASDTVATYAVANNFSAAQTTSLTGLALTSTDGGVLVNTTAATGGTTVQMSPRLRLRGTAWDTSASETVDFFIENLPATAATPTGTLNVGYSLNGAAATFPLTLTSGGTLTVLGSALVGSVLSNFVKRALGRLGEQAVAVDGLREHDRHRDERRHADARHLHRRDPDLGLAQHGGRSHGHDGRELRHQLRHAELDQRAVLHRDR